MVNIKLRRRELTLQRSAIHNLGFVEIATCKGVWASNRSHREARDEAKHLIFMKGKSNSERGYASRHMIQASCVRSMSQSVCVGGSSRWFIGISYTAVSLLLLFHCTLVQRCIPVHPIQYDLCLEQILSERCCPRLSSKTLVTLVDQNVAKAFLLQVTLQRITRYC